VKNGGEGGKGRRKSIGGFEYLSLTIRCEFRGLLQVFRKGLVKERVREAYWKSFLNLGLFRESFRREVFGRG